MIDVRINGEVELAVSWEIAKHLSQGLSGKKHLS